MRGLILEDGSPQRQHRQRLNALLTGTKGTLRIASAYVTDRKLLTAANGRDRRLLISLLPVDIVSGATSLETLEAFIKAGVECRVLPAPLRLHAKVYIFGATHAVVTSANLTGSAFNSNIEAGVELKGKDVKQLSAWFDGFWTIAAPVNLAQLSEWQREMASIRRDYVEFWKKRKTKLQVSKLSDGLQGLFANAGRFFVCNTDRRYGERTPTRGYVLEEKMHNRGFAIAWESFRFPSHMERVEPGDAIFMYAKGVGIIGIGCAKAKFESLPPGHPDRVHDFSKEGQHEWRVPVQWLAWIDEASAYRRYNAPNSTFWDVSDSKYEDFREDVKTHFLANT